VCTVHLFRDATHQLRYETYVEQILCTAAQLFGPQQTMARVPTGHTILHALSAREKQVLGLMVQGKAAREIAETLGSAMSRCETIFRLSCANSGVHTQRQVIKLALEHHLV